MKMMKPKQAKVEKVSDSKAKVEKVMHEYKEGMLRSGSKHGPKVTKRAQAQAIAMSEAGMHKAMKDKGGRGK